MGETAAADLAMVRRRLKDWRKRYGGRGRRLPEDVWSAAAAVAREHGVYATAQALGLSYQGLKDRVTANQVHAGFVEVKVDPLPPSTGTRIELVSASGEQVRIHLSGPWTADLADLAEAFWSRRS